MVQYNTVREFMRAFAAAGIRRLISPSMRFEVREYTARIREQFSRACLWRWEIAKLSQTNSNNSYDIVFLGRKTHREVATALLMSDGNAETCHFRSIISGNTALISEMPVPHALRVPCYLRVIIPLKKPIEEIAAGFGDNLSRLLRKHVSNYKMQQALSLDDIDWANQEMLQPYAFARHGTAAAQIDTQEVRRIAQQAGRLDFVLLDKEVVACNLGCEFTNSGKRYWSTIRFGYPKAVFSDTKLLATTNAISFYLALEWAHKNGFDYYDMGTCLGRPEDELLQWKKRWGGLLDTTSNHGYLHVRLPRVGAAQFLWDTPLFSVEGKQLTLHLGLPDGPCDADIVIRYRKMKFAGLFKIYLHCARTPSEHLLEKLCSLCKQLEAPAIIVVNY